MPTVTDTFSGPTLSGPGHGAAVLFLPGRPRSCLLAMSRDLPAGVMVADSLEALPTRLREYGRALVNRPDEVGGLRIAMFGGADPPAELRATADALATLSLLLRAATIGAAVVVGLGDSQTPPVFQVAKTEPGSTLVDIIQGSGDSTVGQVAMWIGIVSVAVSGLPLAIKKTAESTGDAAKAIADALDVLLETRSRIRRSWRDRRREGSPADAQLLLRVMALSSSALRELADRHDTLFVEFIAEEQPDASGAEDRT